MSPLVWLCIDENGKLKHPPISIADAQKLAWLKYQGSIDLSVVEEEFDKVFEDASDWVKKYGKEWIKKMKQDPDWWLKETPTRA